MSRFIPAFAAAALIASPALADPVTVTRFLAAGGMPAHGSFAVTTTPGVDPTTLDLAPWLDAVRREMAAHGFVPSAEPNPDLVVEVRLDRQTLHVDRNHAPVSVGVAGAGDNYHSSVGLGIGFSFGGGPKDRVATHLVVTINDRAGARPLWEARADNLEDVKNKRGGADVAAPRIAQAMFAGFPGTSGETKVVK
jgi:hypothetical protein